MSNLPGLGQQYKTGSQNRNTIILKIILTFFFIYLFILSISLLGSAFKLFGKEFAESIFTATANPLVGLMIGVLATAVIQSSSTTTSIVVGLVASGVLPFDAAIPMVMGANIGTSVTNILVSLGHITRGEEFQRAFTGSMLHDFFNVCSVIVILPIQMGTNFLGKTAVYLESIFSGFGGLKFTSPLKTITKPVTAYIISLCNHSGLVAAIISFVLLFIALHFIVKLLKSMVLSRVEKFFQRYIFRTPLLSFFLGIMLTAFVQSSSITTSIVVPLLGAGVLTITQIYPYLLGANIGTTITAFLASFVTGSHAAVAVAFAHLTFNLFGIMIFWPLKAIPIWLSNKLSVLTQKSKLVPILYIIVVFFIIPGVFIYLYK